MLTTGHLFSGGGGGLLADAILGHKPVFAVEWDRHCCRTLRLRADEWFQGLQVHEGDVRLFDPSPYKGRVDCLHAGFPCQDISAAGNGEGINGERSGLVSEVFRTIDIIHPGLVYLENSPRIRTKGRDRVIAALVARGYAWRDGVLAASDVGARHDRKRWWCLAANADGLRKLQQERRLSNQWGRINNSAKENANTDSERCQDSGGVIPEAMSKGGFGRPTTLELNQNAGARAPAWFETEPDVGRLVYGVADELVPGAVKALGNGQVPLQAAAAFMILSGQVGT